MVIGSLRGPPEIPGANGHGRTIDECRESLSEAIQLILDDRSEDGIQSCERFRA